MILNKIFFRLIINSVYEKAIEIFGKRINVQLVNNVEEFLKQTSRPTNIAHKIFSEKYAAIHKIKSVLMLNKPIYVGFPVLELSKWLMHDFNYNFVKKN